MTEKDNQNAAKHGGAGAIRRLSKGEPFVGLAKAAQDDVLDRIETGSMEGELQRNAVRLQAAADIYWPVFVKTLEEGDIKRATDYLAKFGWLTNSAIRAWQAAVKLKPKDDDSGATEVLATYRNTKPTSPQEGQNAPNN